MNHPVLKVPAISRTSSETSPPAAKANAVIRNRCAGVSLVELVATMAIVLVLTAITVPAVSTTIQTYKMMSTARMIAAELTLARMRAAASFTQGEVSFNTSARTFQIQLYNKTTSAFAAEGGAQYLISEITFGYGTISTPAGTQPTIAQSTQIIFNSRGIPVDNTGAPTGTYAIYLTNGVKQYYAVSVSVNSAIYIWRYNGSGWTQVI